MSEKKGKPELRQSVDLGGDGAGGKPDGWSDMLWYTYKAFGESDKKYVESCNRFLKAMLDLYPVPASELPHELGQSFKGHTTKPDGTPLEDELDTYRAWYTKHIKWPEKCRCDIEDWFVDPEGDPVMDFDQDVEDWVPRTRVRPWFLAASIQLGKRFAKGQIPDYPDIFVSSAGRIPAEDYGGQEKIKEYLTQSGWAVDQSGDALENVPQFWPFSETRKPDESLKDFINKVVKWTNLYMSMQIQDGALTKREGRGFQRVSIQGRPLDPAKGYERMLVRRMFGETVPSIAKAEENALLKKTGRPPADPKREVHRRTKLIAEHLGFLPPSSRSPRAANKKRQG